MESKAKGTFRSRTPKLWQLLLATCILYLVALLASSEWKGDDEKTPEGLFAKACELRDEGKFEQAQAMFERVVGLKPPMPAIFLEAEKEMNQARLKALEARRKAAEEAEQKKKEAEKDSQQQDGEKDSQEQVKPPEIVPDVNVPELPDIGGEM